MPVSLVEIPTESGSLPMVWWEQPEAANKLAIVLPGQWFGCGPLPTAYATLALQARGADVVWVNYSYDREAGFARLDQAEQENWLFQDARAGMESALSRGPRDRYVVTGKSLGTLAMTQLMDEGRLPADARTIWLTPMLRDGRVRRALEALDRPGLLVIGDQDSHFNPAFIDALANRGMCHVVVLAGANHGLTVAGDLAASARVVEHYLIALSTFLDRD
jgi:predicted alpha/beta-hydrolase family hydrolase